ncbi:MAG: HD domain-containing protein [Candidatus Dojkabacteria bacterium]
MVDKALAIAITVHNGKVRRVSGAPVFEEHIMAVANLSHQIALSKCEAGAEIDPVDALVAGLLHDCVEDYAWQLGDHDARKEAMQSMFKLIQELFPEEISRSVYWLTVNLCDNQQLYYPPWLDGYQKTILETEMWKIKLPIASELSKVVKLADLALNTHDMKVAPDGSQVNGPLQLKIAQRMQIVRIICNVHYQVAQYVMDNLMGINEESLIILSLSEQNTVLQQIMRINSHKTDRDHGSPVITPPGHFAGVVSLQTQVQGS